MFHPYGMLSVLHSFPTRRSSDLVPQADQSLHRIGRRRVHPDAAVPIHRHEPERLIHHVAHDRQIEMRSEEHTSELQSLTNLVCRLLLEKTKNERTSTARTIHATA